MLTSTADASSSGSRQRAPELPAVTSFRFVLAFTVVLIHYKGQIGDFRISFPVENLSNVVTGFFLVSGFLLTYQYAHSGWKTKTSVFWKTRFARIVPVYWFFLGAALAALPLWLFIPDTSLWPLVIGSNVLLLQGFSTNPHVYFGVIPPAYTLSAEVMCYFLFPFLMQDWSRWRRWLFLSVLLALILPIAARYERDAAFLRYAYGASPLGRFVEFMTGCLLAKAYLRFHAHRVNRKILPVLEICGIATVMVLAYLPQSVFLYRLSGGVAGISVVISRLTALFGYSTMIWVLACGRGVTVALLSGSVLVFLGQASYALFLVHDLVVRFLLFHRDLLRPEDPTLVFAAYVAISIGLSCAAFVWVEKPWRKALLTCFFSEPRSARSVARAVRAPVLSTAILALVIVGAADRFPSTWCRRTESEGTPLAEAKNIRFGQVLVLKRAFRRESDQGTTLYTKWRSKDGAGQAEFVTVGLLGKGGDTVWTTAKRIRPPETGTWYAVFTLPRAELGRAQDLFFYISSKLEVLPVVSGRRDWGDRRLLLSLADLEAGE